jgi:hypothetical protein
MNTMNRCKPLSLPCLSPPDPSPTPDLSGTRPRLHWTTAALLGLTLATFSPALLAQPVGRSFPAKALRGTLTVTAPPEVLMDGQPDRLSPGARIRNPQNAFVMSASLVGVPLVVNFTRENTGQIHEVWLLSPEEAAEKRERATPERNFLFSSEADTAPRDDGKTPFHLLPKFPQP